VGAKMHPSVARMNRKTPISATGRRPRLSAIGPMKICKTPLAAR